VRVLTLDREKNRPAVRVLDPHPLEVVAIRVAPRGGAQLPDREARGRLGHALERAKRGDDEEERADQGRDGIPR
jgi:hypothetical protein